MYQLAEPTERRLRFREILLGNRCEIAASTFDPISARIAQGLGYRIGILGGSVASMQVLGAPDITLLNAAELVEQARTQVVGGPQPMAFPTVTFSPRWFCSHTSNSSRSPRSWRVLEVISPRV